jgi:hypothetical protein
MKGAGTVHLPIIDGHKKATLPGGFSGGQGTRAQSRLMVKAPAAQLSAKL